jgi:hypothetical protein
VFIDLDKDNKTDILIKSGFQVSWIRNTATNYSFAPQQIYTTYDSDPNLAAADMDNDGDVDVVVYQTFNSTHGFVKVLENVNGYFLGYNLYLVAVVNPALALWDYDSDGRMDISVIDTLTMVVHHNLGSNTFSIQVVPHSLRWVVNPSGFKPSRLAFLGAYPNVVVAGTWANYLTYFYYTGTSILWTTVGGNYDVIAIGIADFNGDGAPDFVSAGENCWNMNYFLNNGTGIWPNHPVLSGATCYQASTVAAGDIDGDGYGDIVYSKDSEVDIAWLSAGGLISSYQYVGNFNGDSFNGGNQIYEVGTLYPNALNNKDIALVTINTIEIYTSCLACPSCPQDSFVNATTGLCSPCPSYATAPPGSNKCVLRCLPAVCAPFAPVSINFQPC